VDLGLEGRVALVMGASRGLGRGIAATLAREGARVAGRPRGSQGGKRFAASNDTSRVGSGGFWSILKLIDP
jgi:3-oxoacyl-[acyl-carrier protein] reductase